MEGLRIQTGSHDRMWGLGTIDRWGADLTTGALTFTSPEVVVTTQLQVVGTHDTNAGSFCSSS